MSAACVCSAPPSRPCHCTRACSRPPCRPAAAPLCSAGTRTPLDFDLQVLELAIDTPAPPNRLLQRIQGLSLDTLVRGNGIAGRVDE